MKALSFRTVYLPADRDSEQDARALAQKEVRRSLPGDIVVVCDFHGAVLRVYQK